MPVLDDGALARAGSTTQPQRVQSRALNVLVFSSADIQAGFGPFVAVYLTARGWTQTDIGTALSAGGIVSVATQVPLGAAVDAIGRRRIAAACALLALAASAIALAVCPTFAVVLSSRALQSVGGGALGILIVAFSLDLVGRAGMPARSGRNIALAAIGTAAVSAAMGGVGYLFSGEMAFLLVAATTLPAIAVLPALPDHGAGRVQRRRASIASVPLSLDRKRVVLVLSVGAFLFMTAYGSMLVLAADVVAHRSAQTGLGTVAGAVIVQQVVIALLAPAVGRLAEQRGRKPLFMVGLFALPLRGLLFVFFNDPASILAIQVLDGLTIATVFVLTPVIIADIAAGDGRFNLVQGVVGMAAGIGSIVGPPSVGLCTDHLGSRAAFLLMAGLAMATVVLFGAGLPETGSGQSAVQGEAGHKHPLQG